MKINDKTITLRELSAEDYDALVRLWEEGGLPYKPRGRDTREAFTAQLPEPTSIYLGAEVDGELAGAVLGTHDGRKGWINRLVVSPAHRRLGVGRALVDEVERRFAELGLGIFACLIEDWNDASAAVFERLGYRPFREATYYTKKLDPDV
jgi:ribosomal protein S18 acetylase RimI-like enzyme